MRCGVARVRAREAAAWLADYVGKQDPESMRFSKDELLGAFGSGFDVGAKDAEEEWTIERSTGQRQLDEATAMIREAAQQFRQYESHHRHRAKTYTEKLERKRAESHPSAIVRMEDRVLDSTVKADRNAAIAARLEAWLAGKSWATISEADAAILRPWLDAIGTTDEPEERFANRIGYGNVRPVTDGPLAEAGVVQAIVDAAGGDATAALSMASDTAFRLKTPDPRFDPDKPVMINGFLYHPTKEDLCKPSL